MTLSPHGPELLRAVRDRHPEMSAAEIVEAALAERFGREQELTRRPGSPAEVRAWLDELAALSDKIPARQG